tara:strand:+ start:111 stop:257 length:147 start_codon:yes stop_codon:yes gene_type:complete
LKHHYSGFDLFVNSLCPLILLQSGESHQAAFTTGIEHTRAHEKEKKAK